MKCSDCGRMMIDGEECYQMTDTAERFPLCSKCLKEHAPDRVEPPPPPDTAPVLDSPPANEPPTARTRKPRADKGKPRATKAGQFVLQQDSSALLDPNKLGWLDISTHATEAKAWDSVVAAGTYRVVRVHGQERTAKEQTVITFE